MAQDFSIPNEKLAQVAPLLTAHHMDMWLTFVRETPLSPDPSLKLIFGTDVTWLSAFIVTANDDRIAIVGRFDVENVQRMGGYREIIPYDADIAPALKEVLTRLAPATIALNYSVNDAAADGLSHGLWHVLNTILSDTPFKHRLVSAEPMIAALRGRKTAAELARIRQAITTTETIIQAVTDTLKPDLGEEDIFAFVAEQMEKHGVTSAWKPCPNVNAGPDSPVGHGLPSNQYKTARGQVLHMDLGVSQNGYVSDMQRVWYLKKEGETSAPEPLQKAFAAVRGAIEAAAAVMKPGVMGWQVDEAARKHLVAAGYAEYQHATGHHIGQTVHDGATVLGPRWPRYGTTPEGILEAGNVFTLELGVSLPEFGYIGLEEDVLVTETGIEYLSKPQTELILI